ncbi:MAG: pyruvate kinase [Deltaproteobacteria bacterium]|nr:pyruvate kinase [Deltaproteobacteria bacterium]
MIRKTKIIATLGPATCEEPQIRRLIAEGLDIVRLNGSHNTLDWHRTVIRRVRAISPLIPILLDIPGRKVRTGILAKDVPLTLGGVLVFTTDDSDAPGEKIPVTYRDLHLDLRAGHIVLADDGTLKFHVVEVRGRDIICRIENAGILRSSKGLNVPYVKLNGPVLADRDRRMLEFACAEGVDFIGVSFVESASHVAEVRKLLEGRSVGIVSKIENKYGLDNLREIIIASDGVMIDRGDLTAETELETLAIMQKRILREAQLHGKPVIVATEMLHTMIHNPQPTKAEVNDISTAVLDGASALMLSGETAIGDFPEQAISLMSRVSSVVENADAPELAADFTEKDEMIPSAIGGAILELCRKLPVTKVICLTASGFAPKMIAKYRLRQPILAVTNSIEVGRKVSMSWGVQPIVLELKFSRESADHIIRTLKDLYERSIISSDDLIIVTAVKHPRAGNKMNTIEIYHVNDLVESQGWSRDRTT